MAETQQMMVVRVSDGSHNLIVKEVDIASGLPYNFIGLEAATPAQANARVKIAGVGEAHQVIMAIKNTLLDDLLKLDGGHLTQLDGFNILVAS